MASARITQRWADGTEFEVEVYVDTTFPDALNQVAVEANKLWHEALAEDAES